MRVVSWLNADIQVWSRGVRYVRPVVAQVSGGWFHYATPCIPHWEPSYAPMRHVIYTSVKSPDAHSGFVDTVSQHRQHPLTVAMTRNSNISIVRIFLMVVDFVRLAGGCLHWTSSDYILFAVTRCGVLWAEYVLFAVHEV